MTSTITAPTANLIVSNLRSIIKDYNYWGTSESDSPLTIRRTKTLTDPQILSADASMRRKVGGTNYLVPINRSIARHYFARSFYAFGERCQS